MDPDRIKINNDIQLLMASVNEDLESKLKSDENVEYF